MRVPATDPSVARGGLLAPFRDSPVFAVLWIGQLAVQIGLWMQTVVGQSILVAQGQPTVVVALVQTAMTIPVFIVSVPAGALADLLPRRALAIAVNGFAALVCCGLLIAQISGHLDAVVLLVMLVLLGAAQAFNHPTWAATVPDLVRRESVPAASMAASINVNLARVVGPFIGGVVVATAGPAVAFAIGAVFYGAFVVAAIVVGPYSPRPGRQRFAAAIRAGARHVRHTDGVVGIMVLGTVWFFCCSAFWALIPVVALREMGLGAEGYGIVLAVVGSGALLGTPLVVPLRRRLSPRAFLALAAAFFGASQCVIALNPAPAATFAAFATAGAAWTVGGAMLMSHAQLLLSSWVRARGISIYLVGTQGGLAVGSVFWGGVAGFIGAPMALVAAAAALGIFIALVLLRPPLISADSSISAPWQVLGARTARGRVLVEIEYRVDPESVRDFVMAMRDVRRSRLRTGATSWRMYQDANDPGLFIEVYSSPSWADHQLQHSDRQTAADERVRSVVRRHVGSITARHLVEVDPRRSGRARSE